MIAGYSVAGARRRERRWEALRQNKVSAKSTNAKSLRNKRFKKETRHTKDDRKENKKRSGCSWMVTEVKPERVTKARLLTRQRRS